MSQVRVSENTHQLLKTLSLNEGKPMQEILDRAVEVYRRRSFLEGLSEDFRVLRGKDADWNEHEREMAVWDNVLDDQMGDE